MKGKPLVPLESGIILFSEVDDYAYVGSARIRAF
jgi:hypothetical protein